ncbi:MAG: hypothetical protein R3F62_08020 [Planctomycetota bacterium]
MGNLNKFYLLGRVTKATEAEGTGDARVAKVWLAPGTHGGGRRRGATLPLLLHAYGPQVEAALELRVGQGVLARGQLRQESRGDGDVLVAQIQALEPLANARPPRKPRPEGAPAEEGEGEEGRSAKRRRRRRRGPRKPEGEGGGEAAEAPQPPQPAKPVVPPPPPPVAPPPDPSYTSDIPF